MRQRPSRAHPAYPPACSRCFSVRPGAVSPSRPGHRNWRKTLVVADDKRPLQAQRQSPDQVEGRQPSLEKRPRSGSGLTAASTAPCSGSRAAQAVSSAGMDAHAALPSPGAPAPAHRAFAGPRMATIADGADIGPAIVASRLRQLALVCSGSDALRGGRSGSQWADSARLASASAAPRVGKVSCRFLSPFLSNPHTLRAAISVARGCRRRRQSCAAREGEKRRANRTQDGSPDRGDCDIISARSTAPEGRQECDEDCQGAESPLAAEECPRHPAFAAVAKGRDPMACRVRGGRGTAIECLGLQA